MTTKFIGHAFLFFDGENEAIISNTSLSIPWMDLTELYFNFLQASGYVLTRQDFADQIREMFDENN